MKTSLRSFTFGIALGWFLALASASFAQEPPAAPEAAKPAVQKPAASEAPAASEPAAVDLPVEPPLRRLDSPAQSTPSKPSRDDEIRRRAEENRQRAEEERRRARERADQE